MEFNYRDAVFFIIDLPKFINDEQDVNKIDNYISRGNIEEIHIKADISYDIQTYDLYGEKNHFYTNIENGSISKYKEELITKLIKLKINFINNKIHLYNKELETWSQFLKENNE